jgi:hypothetical protein
MHAVGSFIPSSVGTVNYTYVFTEASKSGIIVEWPFVEKQSKSVLTADATDWGKAASVNDTLCKLSVMLRDCERPAVVSETDKWGVVMLLQIVETSETILKM